MRQFLFFCFMAVAMASFALPVDYEEALSSLNNYLRTSNISTVVSPSLSYKHKAPAHRNVAGDAPLYYVFNIENSGYVIVSGDDALPPILAHIDGGEFCVDSIGDRNPAFACWLDAVENCILCAREKNSPVYANHVPSQSKSPLPAGVEPLIKTKWAQGTPYNNLLPDDGIHGGKSIAGCVSTAFAQIFKYYEYPDKGTGVASHRTEKHGFYVDVDLSSFEFDWDNMLDEYTDEATEVQQQAVAELMYAIGASAESDYCTLATPTHNSKTIIALSENWGYTGAYMAKREYYTANEWDEMVKHELALGRPVYYTGESASSGHAFICDGYNATGLFHINWGWGGYSNGYFELSSLLDYVAAQDIVIGVSPDVKEPHKAELFYKQFVKPYSMAFTRRNLQLNIQEVSNISHLQSFEGEFGIALVDANDSIFSSGLSGIELPPNHYYSDLNYSMRVADDVPDGDYRIVAVMRCEGVDSLILSRGKKDNNYIGYFKARLSGDSIMLSFPDDYSDQADGERFLEVTGFSYEGKPYAGHDINIICTVKNISNSSFRGYLNVGVTGEAVGIELLPGEEKSVRLLANLPSSDTVYTVYINSYNDNTGNVTLASYDIELIQPATGAPVITFSPEMLRNTLFTNSDTLSLSVNVTNSGGFYQGYVQLHLYSSETSYRIQSAEYVLDKGDSAVLDFSAPLAEVSPGAYECYVSSYVDGSFIYAYPQFRVYVKDSSSNVAPQGPVLLSNNGYTITRGDKLDFRTEIMNVGDAVYDGMLFLFGCGSQYIDVEIAPGETKEVEMGILLSTLPATTANLVLYSDDYEILTTRLLTEEELFGNTEIDSQIDLQVDIEYDRIPIKGYDISLGFNISNNSDISYSGVLNCVVNDTLTSRIDVAIPAKGSSFYETELLVPEECDTIKVAFYQQIATVQRFLGEFMIETVAPSAGTPELYFSSHLSEVVRYSNDDIYSATVRVTNLGGIYDERLYYCFRNCDTGNSKRVYLGNHVVNRDDKEEIDFEYELSELPAGRYLCYMYYCEADGNSLYLYQGSETSSIFIDDNSSRPVLVSYGSAGVYNSDSIYVNMAIANAGNAEFDDNIQIKFGQVVQQCHVHLLPGDVAYLQRSFERYDEGKDNLTVSYKYESNINVIYANTYYYNLLETAIDKVYDTGLAEGGNGAVYDLYGRMVEKPGRGIYIINGRKVLVK